MRPILGAVDITVLYRVPVDIVKMPLKVFLVTDYVIPEAGLPYSQGCRDVVGIFIVEREIPFDALQYIGEITAFLFDAHQPMKMIWQNHIGQQTEGMDLLNISQGFNKQLDICFGAQERSTILCYAGYEDDCIGYVVTVEIGHFESGCSWRECPLRGCCARIPPYVWEM